MEEERLSGWILFKVFSFFFSLSLFFLILFLDLEFRILGKIEEIEFLSDYGF